MPAPAPKQLPATNRAAAAAVYLPVVPEPDLRQRPRTHRRGRRVPEALVALSARAGLPLWIPDDVAGHCCGVPWSSKGYQAGHDQMAARTAAALQRWSDGGRLPVVIDASSCAQAVMSELEARPGRGARLGRVGPRPAARAAAGHAPAGRGRGASDLRLHPARPVGQAGGDRPAACRRGRDSGRQRLLRDGRRSWLAASRAARIGAATPSSTSSTQGTATPTSRATGPARSRCVQETGRPYASFVLVLEQLTR